MSPAFGAQLSPHLLRVHIDKVSKIPPWRPTEPLELPLQTTFTESSACLSRRYSLSLSPCGDKNGLSSRSLKIRCRFLALPALFRRHTPLTMRNSSVSRSQDTVG